MSLLLIASVVGYAFRSNELASRHLIRTFRDLFIAYGVPEEVSSDEGPQYTSGEFQDFLTQGGVKHRLFLSIIPNRTVERK